MKNPPQIPIIKWTLIGSLIGLLSGSASAVFLHSLTWATQTRQDSPLLLLLLPVVGLFMGYSYYRFGANAGLGNHLVIAEANKRNERIPLRMAPMVLVGTVLTQLFGGSAGREGTAIQMGASLADSLKRILQLEARDHRLMIIAGISGGFGSVFGVPIAGFIFGLEVQKIGRIRYNAVIPALMASVVGDWTTRTLDAPHAKYPELPALGLDLGLFSKVILAGALFGLSAILFIELISLLKKLWLKITPRKWLHPVIGGFIIIGLDLIFGSQYLGLSLELIEKATQGEMIEPWVFALKTLFTGVTLSSGFLGGEVTPLFVIGSTLGSALAPLFQLDPSFLAALGLVAVFAGASNTPLACALMGVELFGGGSILYVFTACYVAFIASGHRGIYQTQKLWINKNDPAEIPSHQSIK